MRLTRERAPLFAPVDISWLVVLRVGFGALMLWHALSYLALGRVRRFWIEPAFHFEFPGFGWVVPWPGEGMIVHFWLIAVLGVFVALGFLYRLSAALLFVGFTHVFLLDQARYQNHTYLICLLAFLAIFLPANRAASVDARLRPSLRADTVPAWTLYLMRFQVGVPYLFGGVAKLNPDWLRGEPLREWLARESGVLGQEWSVAAFSYGGIAIDLLAVPLLLWRRTRFGMFVVLILFHCCNAWLFVLGIFPWMMIALTTVFLEPDWPRRLLRRPAPAEEHGGAIPRRAGLVTAGLGVWVLVQVLVPLRHFAIPGNVAWTAEGQQFSWHMKLNDTAGQVYFRVVDRATGATTSVDPTDTLTSWQFARMDGRPDMIRQFARHLAEEARRTGRDVEVYVDAWLSLNHRPMQQLVDPGVDLARTPESLGFASAPWIVPLMVGR